MELIYINLLTPGILRWLLDLFFENVFILFVWKWRYSSCPLLILVPNVDE
jgi:hypothetical protein